eukprot:57665-Prymnesium_polylepis.1
MRQIGHPLAACLVPIHVPILRSGLVPPLCGLSACHTRHGVCPTQTNGIRQPGGSGETRKRKANTKKRIFGRTDA